MADVLGLDLEDRFVRAKTKSVLGTWIKNGMLKVVERNDAKRRSKSFVEVGKWATD